jgi:hypothetical protein
MRGHDSILALRKRDQKPVGFVDVLLQPYPRRGDWATREFCRGRVFVESSDAIDRLDLRFLVGCDVMVDGSEPERVRRLYAALERHKARRVIANCGRVVNGTGHLDFILDTQEILTWHA